MKKTIGVFGLGLIGGSLCKAIKASTSHIVYGFDKDAKVTNVALEQGVIDNILSEELFLSCDILLIALYPKDTKEFVEKNIKSFKKGAIIIDTAGVKENLCKAMSKLAFENGVYFIGGHPMAGIEKSGFSSSNGELFKGATMILCKDSYTNMVALKAAELFFISLGFAKATITTAEKHDKVIAFTSQLAHIVSNAYIKSETAKNQEGFSAGSYKDLTRVAELNENMWTELFFENKNNLIFEIEGICTRLNEYVNALKNGDQSTMKKLLLEGKLAKKAVG